MRDSAPLLQTSRTWLFVPGDRPERFARAAASGAQVVIVDIEDAVSPDNKEAARAAVSTALGDGFRCVVRVSAFDTSAGARDLEVLAQSARPLAVMLAKCESADDAEQVRARLGVPVIALIESAAGVEAASSLASSPAVTRLALGPADLTVELDADLSDEVLGPIRSRLVVASRAAGIAGPLDGPSLHIADTDAVREEAFGARRVGMGGKLCIHPDQIPVVESAFRPSEEAIDFARRVLDAAEGRGAVQVDGIMVDLPVIERARRVLADVLALSGSDEGAARA